MYGQQTQEDILYLIFYGAGAMLSLTACCYLLFRRSNAIAPDVTSPVRLRRWTAALFASMALSHVWYLPTFFLSSSEDILLSNVVGSVLDFLTLIPFAIVVLLTMLQDRRRPLWPVFVMMVPLIVGLIACGVSRSDFLLPMLYAYYLVLGIGLIIYMVYATRQYGRWLRDNFADLEHKEVWQSFVIFLIILFTFVIYALEPHAPFYKYVSQLNVMLYICILLWRVETLSDLSGNRGDRLRDGNRGDRFMIAHSERITQPVPVIPPAIPPSLDLDDMEDRELPQTIHDKIGPLLQLYCIDTQLYLQHDLSLGQLSQIIGTNRLYLSKYFSRQGTTYNDYINSLRIQHFMKLYHKAVASQRHFTAKQLAYDSGYRNYTTFSGVFKQLKGQTVTEWMRDTAK